MSLTNFRFTFKRFAFTTLLALEPRLLRWFRVLLVGSVVFAILAVVVFWILIAPKSLQSISAELEQLPPKLDISILTSPPFSTLSDYATRPVPVDDTQALRFSP